MIEILRRWLADPVPEAGTKLVVCLGNPGTQYSTTRHNVGWWLADRLAAEWELGRFRKHGALSLATGSVAGTPVQVIKPLTFMNRSGAVMRELRLPEGFDAARDLMVVVDDVALEPGRFRFRASGSAGGHNGLKSMEAALGTRDYPRLRIGVGAAPAGGDLADWVLSAPAPEDRRLIMGTFPALAEGLGHWITDGLEAAMSRTRPDPGHESGS